MRLARRRFLQLAGTAAALPALPRFAAALDYPVRPIHFVVGFAAGSGLDITARLIGQFGAKK
jgi:tripartite-type tricarboxylate transporter receptor subunit TctC